LQRTICTTSPSANLCPSYNMNRLLRVVALSSAFKHHNLRHLEGLMRHTWSFLEQMPVWQFESNDGNWIDCEVDVQKALHETRSLGRHECTVRAATWCYSYNLSDLQQLNLSTRRSRRIRCRDPFCSAPVMPTRSATLLSGPQWQFQCGHGWADCHSSLQVLLEAAWESEQRTLMVPGPAGFMLEVDLQKMTQTNSETGRVRQLRRSP